jgi:hypothetical protein
LRVLEDYELDHVSGGLDGETEFYAEPFNVPDGFTMENISGAILQQDLATGEWTVELVFESDFTEAGYASGDGGSGGGGFYVDEPIGQGSSDFGPDVAMAPAERRTESTKVTKTKTGPSATIVINFFGLATFTFSTGGTTTTTETTTTSAGRITSQGKTGRLPSR